MKEIFDGTEYTKSHWKSFVKPTICIDFHHTITTECEACSDFKGTYKIQEGAVETINSLNKDFTIIIYTGDPEKLISAGILPSDYKKKVENFLKSNNIHYDNILFSKPPAIFIIDDRAIHHKGWESTISEIKSRLKKV